MKIVLKVKGQGQMCPLLFDLHNQIRHITA